MIQCPKCASSLPDWAQSCQFCNTCVKDVKRPVAVKQHKGNLLPTAKWVWAAYYIIAFWWMLSGSIGVISGAIDKEGPLVATIVVGGATVLLGVGLAMRIELLRGIANIFAWVRIIFSGLGLIGALGMMMLFPLIGVLWFLLNLIDIVSAGLLVYLIGETGPQ
jgi:hypothetical protein